MTRREDLRKRDPTSPELPRLNYDIQNRIYAHKRQKLRDFVEILDQKTDVTKLWRTIKGIDGRAKREADNEAITFNGISFSSSKQLATKFNKQFNTSKLGRHTSSSETRLVTRETKKKSLEMAQTSSSSCHQTSVFHLSKHFFAVSLNLLRSSNEQGCSRREHCIMCAVFSVARPHSQVVSPS